MNRTPNPPKETRLSLEEQQDLVVQYTPLVKRVARTLPLEIPGVLEFEDAVGYGMCGPGRVEARYALTIRTKGTNFHAYAVRRIRGSMMDAFRRMDRLEPHPASGNAGSPALPRRSSRLNSGAHRPTQKPPTSSV
ncbi:MAG: sigma factor [Dehalococcoidia bacterium]|nr:sigma factor [Dehalococcoidia bacterium]